MPPSTAAWLIVALISLNSAYAARRVHQLKRSACPSSDIAWTNVTEEALMPERFLNRLDEVESNRENLCLGWKGLLSIGQRP